MGASFSQNMPFANSVKAGRWCLLEQTERTSWLRIASWIWHHAITDKVARLKAARCEFDPAATLMNHRLREGFREGFRLKSLKMPRETTVTFVLMLFIVKRVVKLHVVFLKMLRTVLPSWQVVMCQPSILCQGIRLFRALPSLPSGVILRPRVLDMPKCPKPWAVARQALVPPASTFGMAKYRDD